MLYAPQSLPRAVVSEAVMLRRMVQALEKGSSPPEHIDDIARKFHIKTRTLYDFVDIASVFGVCLRAPNNTLEWFGIDSAGATIDRFRDEVAAEGDDPNALRLFNYPLDPSLHRIASGIVKLCFFLNVNSLDLRKVGKIFAQGKTKFKTMLRKLYTVVAAMEILGIVTRTSVVSEIVLRAPLERRRAVRSLGVEVMLNSPEEVLLVQKYEWRRRALCL
jgi:hypothetical protein